MSASLRRDRLLHSQHAPTPPWRHWLRLAAIATGAVILASCRSLPPAASRACPPTVSCQPAAPCESIPCPPCPAPLPPPPTVGPWFVCDGGDGCAPARAVGIDGLENLTAGDTVARFRADDNGPDNDLVHITVSDKACVYAPRFASVREVVRPFEETVPLGPRGMSLETIVGEQLDLQRVRGDTTAVAAAGARRAQPGNAISERLGPLAVDQGDLVHEDGSRVRPAAYAADDQLELERQATRPLVAVGFDVPMAWTCVKEANVLVGGQAAEVVAADRGTATLRFESPGRAELTLCKRAGSDTARSGDELDFTIVMLNSGDRALADIVLVDAIPGRLELIPGSPASSLPAEIDVTTADDGGPVVRWRIQEPLPPGASGFVRFRTRVR
jgi:uncharacterized repeat protein (TIGR01451 family)